MKGLVILLVRMERSSRVAAASVVLQAGLLLLILSIIHSFIPWASPSADTW